MPVVIKPKIYLAEKGGFEPPVPVSQYGCLANNWFQPLTHFSEMKSFLASDNIATGAGVDQ
jgi:hypothetical protein